MKKIGVILSGCGFMDGAEINEAVLTLLAISRQGATPLLMAPNVNQYHVINHTNGQAVQETRNVLIESSRIARGEIKDINEVSADDFDALMIPGGFGVAKNLSNFAFKGAQAAIIPEVAKMLKAVNDQQKPIGAICISPAVLALLFKAKLTIGSDEATSQIINDLGGQHFQKNANEIQVDEELKIVSTPAFMLNAPLHEISEGIDQCVKKVIELS
jgi:enhancing lycopene biosynthesis protein 2